MGNTYTEVLGGQRNWVQVLCNGGPQALCCLAYLCYFGITEAGIDFKERPLQATLIFAIMGSVLFVCTTSICFFCFSNYSEVTPVPMEIPGALNSVYYQRAIPSSLLLSARCEIVFNVTKMQGT
jgi:hypothetical protein